MSQLANVLNYNEQYAAPSVGDGATEVLWTDRCAYTVTRVSDSGKTFWMVRDAATRLDSNGMSDCQRYAYAAGNSAPIAVRKTKRGWRTAGHNKVLVGVRDEHYDYSF